MWRWLASVNWDAWWIAVPLVVAETYSLIDSLLFGLTMWRLQHRPDPPPPPEGATVDVFITTYNEPLDLVMKTAVAAKAITYPHTTWILDDGDRPGRARSAGPDHVHSGAAATGSDLGAPARCARDHDGVAAAVIPRHPVRRCGDRLPPRYTGVP